MRSHGYTRKKLFYFREVGCGIVAACFLPSGRSVWPWGIKHNEAELRCSVNECLSQSPDRSVQVFSPMGHPDSTHCWTCSAGGITGGSSGATSLSLFVVSSLGKQPIRRIAKPGEAKRSRISAMKLVQGALHGCCGHQVRNMSSCRLRVAQPMISCCPISRLRGGEWLKWRGPRNDSSRWREAGGHLGLF